MTKSNSTATTLPAKPERPEGSPLFWHSSGRWCKKIRGSFAYFGRGSHDEALQLYLDQKDDLHAGRKPREKTEGLTVRDLANRFLTTKKALLDSGELSMSTWRDYYATAERIAEAFGMARLVSDLRPDDFEKLRKKLVKTWGPVRLAKEINQIRIICNYAFKGGLVDRPIIFGEGFRRPSKKVLRLDKRRKGLKLFEAAELRKLIDAAGVPLKAMLLLAINAGYGNADCGRLPMEALDLEGGWATFHREKTGIARRCPLWPETIAALRAALEQRPTPKVEGLEDRAFITSKGESWFKEGTVDEEGKPKNCSDNPVSKEMRKLLDREKVNGSRGFYAIRHTFQTIGDDCGDFLAVRAIMGHADQDISSAYREKINDSRLRKVTDHVRAWLFAAKGGVA